MKKFLTLCLLIAITAILSQRELETAKYNAIIKEVQIRANTGTREGSDSDYQTAVYETAQKYHLSFEQVEQILKQFYL